MNNGQFFSKDYRWYSKKNSPEQLAWGAAAESSLINSFWNPLQKSKKKKKYKKYETIEKLTIQHHA